MRDSNQNELCSNISNIKLYTVLYEIVRWKWLKDSALCNT